MRHVGVREFRDKATTLLAGDEKLVIERHGQPIGYYIPVQRRNQAEIQRRMEALEKAVNEVLRETGMTEDEMVAEIMQDWKS